LGGNMLASLHSATAKSPALARFRSSAAFMLVELMVAAAMIAVAASTCLWALANMNRNANIARLYTGASTVAQNQIDLLLTDSPFNPQKNQSPPELQVGTATQTGIPIYQDPATGVIVSGTMTTQVADVSQTYNSNTLSMYRAMVTISFRYRGRDYSVAMSSIRASDI